MLFAGKMWTRPRASAHALDKQPLIKAIALHVLFVEWGRTCVGGSSGRFRVP
jgi:hypothetical protein